MKTRLVVFALAVAALPLGAACTAEAVTLAQPADGATVSLTPTFSWTLGPNETMSNVEAARTASYDDPRASGGCDGGDLTGTTSCVSPGFWDAGTWYAYATAYDADGKVVRSPFVRFIVPTKIGFGPTDPWGKDLPPVVQTERAAGVPLYAHRKWYVSPYSTIDTSGWLNDPGAKITVTYAVRQGRKVRRRATHIKHAGGEEDWMFAGGDTDTFVLLHVPSVRSGARLRCEIVLEGDGISARKTVTVRNPPRGGRRVHPH
jgi:hypothetical protein